jgi:deoxyribonuclease V
MILAIDVYYINDRAKSVGVLFNHWTDSKNSVESLIIDYQDNVAPYQSGQFYQRELPCIMSLLNKVDLSQISTIVIDGYVHLNDGKIGLGGHLYNALNKMIPIIGVAKKPFAGNSEYLIEVIRGQSKHPLYVTSMGISLERAAENVQSMAGKYRMPDLLSYLDQQTKLFKHEK